MPKQSTPPTLFGRRLREARTRIGMPQDKLGVMIGLDEGCSSARISRYETGIHEPKIATVEKLANALNVPLAYFYCKEDCLAEILICYASFDDNQQQRELLLHALEISRKTTC